MGKFFDRLKTGLFYLYSSLVYLIIFLIVWFISYTFLFPNIYNFMVKAFSATTYGNPETVIVAIDDKSIDKVRWPWKREMYAKIMNYFSDYTDIKIIGLDTVVKGSDLQNPASDRAFYGAVARLSDKLVTAFVPTMQDYPEDVDGGIYEAYFNQRFKINIEDKRTQKAAPLYKSMAVFPAEYFFSVKNVGSSANGMHGVNKTFIKTYSLVNINGELYPSIALRMYLLANDTDKITLYNDKIVVDKTGLKIPVTDKQLFTSNIHFYKYHPGTIYSHKTYSAIDIINSYDAIKTGKKPLINPAEFKGKTVFFGLNARGDVVGLEDSGMTPVGINHPGVDIQASIYDNLVNGQILHRPHLLAEIAVALVLSLITFLLVMNLTFGVSLSVVMGTIIGYILINALMLYPRNIVPDAITPVVVILATLIFGYAFRFILENKNKEKVKMAMGRYLSQDVMQNVVKNIDDIRLGGRKATVTVLFADIRGFTSMSERMTAEEVSVILNEYFSAIEPIITKYNGVINKFIGDAVMAIFGDPIEDELHPMKAVLCANEMLKCVRKLRYKWMDENKPDIEIGIGINTGEVFVGNIGSEKRLEYTVIGDTVNIASRIESYNKVYKTKFLIGSTTYEFVKNRVDVIKIGGVTIRGKQKKMDIYEILRVNSGINDDKNN